MSAPTPDDPYADALSQALSTGKVVIEGAGVQAVVDFTGATPTPAQGGGRPAEHADTVEKDVPWWHRLAAWWDHLWADDDDYPRDQR